MKVFLIGTGAGAAMLTTEAKEAMAEASLIIGAPRVIEECRELFSPGTKTVEEIRTEAIADIVKESMEKEASVAVLFSGDSGFYSGAGPLLDRLSKEGISSRVVPGISSVQLFSAALGKAWQSWRLVSAHGREIDVMAELMHGQDTFFLTDRKMTPGAICRIITEAGLPDTRVWVGEKLGSGEERIRSGRAEEIAGREFDALSVLLTERIPVRQQFSGILDEQVLRGEAPMTKQEIRAAAVNRLQIRPADTVWDIGAGTGSVSVALAEAAPFGRVYAVEQKAEALALMEENRKRFLAWNLTAVSAKAPEGLSKLPAPDAVFLGGTGGKLSEILDVILEKNKDARILLTAILVETLADAAAAFAAHGLAFSVTELTTAESRNVGGKHMMRGKDPIWLVARAFAPEGENS